MALRISSTARAWSGVSGRSPVRSTPCMAAGRRSTSSESMAMIPFSLSVFTAADTPPMFASRKGTGYGFVISISMI